MQDSMQQRATRRRAFLQQTARWTGLPLAGTLLLGGCNPLARGPSEPGTAGGQPVTVRWPNDTQPPSLRFAEEFNRRFNEQYGPKITAVMEPFPEGSWQERYEKWTAMAVSGDLPELVRLCCTYVRPWMLKGLSLELNSFLRRDWKSDEEKDFYPGPYDAGNIQGKQFSIPEAVNINSMYVNKNHLREAALPYPSENWTREQFLVYVTKLHQRNAAGAAVPAVPREEVGGDQGGRWGFDMPFLALDRNVTWIWSHGGEPHDPKDMPIVTKLSYDAPKTVEALQFLHDLIWKHQVSPTSNEQRGGMNGSNAFLNGRIAIYFDASGNAINFNGRAPMTGLDWDFLPLVKGPGGYGSRVGVGGLMVNRQTKAPGASWTVLRELVSRDSQVLRAEMLQAQPSRKSAAEAWEKQFPGKNAMLVRRMAEASRPDPRGFWKDADQVDDILNVYMRAALYENRLTVPDAMRRAMVEVRGFYGASK